MAMQGIQSNSPSKAPGETGPHGGAPSVSAPGRHRRTGRRRGRWHRRVLAYRNVELMPSASPDTVGAECLLLVHVRRVIGLVTYRACDECAEGVITDVVLDEPFRDCGLGTRALSHLRSLHPDVTWRTTLDARLTRALLRRMRIPRSTGGRCSHGRPGVVAPTAM